MNLDTTQTGVSQSPAPASSPVTTEDRFQGLWDSGAFEPAPPKQQQAQAPAQNDQNALNSQYNPAAQQQAPAAEAPTQGEPKVEGEAPKEGEAEEERVYSNIEEYLKDNGIEPQSFQALPVTVKIDGETRQVPLSEVIKSFQLSGHVNNKSIELSNQQKQFEQEQAAARDLYRQQLTGAQTLTQLAHRELLGEFGQINWQQLKEADPATWAVKSMEFQQRQAAINQQLGYLQNAQQAEAHKAQEEAARALPAQRERMLDLRPEWRDPKQFAQDQSAMTAYAKNLGFNEAELSNIFDHRYMAVLADAARYAALQASKPAALKMVRTAPQMAKPGTRTQTDPKQAVKQSAIERFNANPRDNDAQAAMFEALVN